MSPSCPGRRRHAARRRPRRRHRGQEGFKSRARLRAGARRPARQGDGRRRRRPLAEGPYAGDVQDSLTTALVGGQGWASPSSSTRRCSRREHGPRGRAAGPPGHADQLRHAPPEARAGAGRGDPRARHRSGARPARRHPDRDGAPRHAGARARARCCSAPAPRSASRPPPSRSSACARSSPPARPSRDERSAELRGLLAEIAREHGINRALMRQELTFLVAPHPADRPGARGRLRPPGRQPAAPALRAARLSRSGPPGLTLMPISSFYGMQTSLRGLIAQQRMLDTTGHNIANASTRATRARRPCSRPRPRCRSRSPARRRRPAPTSAPASTSGLPPRPRPVPGLAVPRARTRT